ncbi:MAG: hypothetical protein HC879_19040 [Leptolyngbyaceae cyanobacterium SL_5_9]|nr:hypothetical protein [Leptolyngbyaceae cyanobacterium SL_5_9]NJO75815.1 hypothetical protein [Leptolyngbyaceae cyanobacterium RM1_406_9]
MKIVWEPSVYIGNAPVFCTICGRRAYPLRTRGNQLLLAVIYDRHEVVRGEACRDCVASGPTGIKTRLQERIQSLQAQVSELQEMTHEEMQTPSLEQEFQVHRRELP